VSSATLPDAPLRGTVWWFALHPDDEPKPVVVVSADGRNRSAFPLVHVVRITTRPRRPLATVVPLGPDDAPLVGSAMADQLEAVRRDELLGPAGRLSTATMLRIDAALRRMLALN
jgi:mRNA-degrading endonuclease toxin of MazEF toxin-antitoxin module